MTSPLTTLDEALLAVIAILAVTLVVLLIGTKRLARAKRALRESEERSRRMIDRAPVMIWTVRPDTTLDYVNSTCSTFTGLSTAKLLNNGWLDAVHPDDVDHCLGIYVPAIEARTPLTMEYRLRRSDDVYRWILDTAVPKYGQDGTFEGFIGYSIDITEHKNAEETVRESRTAIDVSHQEIQQLAGSLITAHEDERRRLARELHDDLTQRLARLAIDAGRMESAVGAPEGVRVLREDLVRLSEDVHALSYRLHPSVLDDLGLVEALKAECDRVARHGGIRVDVEASSIPATLPAESSLCLFRVAQEALSNATRHGHASAVSVLLSSHGKGLKLEVIDNGSGFDTDHPRDHASLGLASMRERVRLVQGDLDIRSTPGIGTTVVASVPT